MHSFRANTFAARSFKAAHWTGLNAEDYPPDSPGLEYTMPRSRLHYTLPEGRLQATMPRNRLHATIKD